MVRRIAIGWITANTLAWAGAMAAGLPLRGPWGWLACGVVVGTAQWLALRGRVGPAAAWIAATGVAWALGLWAGEGRDWFLRLHPYWAGAVGGTLAGAAQAWILRRRVARAVLWLPATIVSSTLGWVLGTMAGLWVYESRPESQAYFAGGAAGGAVIGAASAPVLVWLMRQTRQPHNSE
jgi:hypothetical protein